MRACPAGNGKGACACDERVTNIRLWPSPRVDIGATNEARADDVASKRETSLWLASIR